MKHSISSGDNQRMVYNGTYYKIGKDMSSLLRLLTKRKDIVPSCLLFCTMELKLTS